MQADEADARDIADLVCEVAPLALPPSSEAIFAQWCAAHADEKAIRQRLTDAASVQYLLRDSQGALGGTAFVHVQDEVAYLGGLMCRMRQAGLGPRLLEACLDTARSRGCNRAYGHVYAGRPALIAVAECLGFRQTRRYDDDPLFPGHTFVVLEKSLR